MHRWNKSKGGGWQDRGIHYNIAILKTLTATFHLIFSDFCLLCVGGVQSHIAIRRVGEYPVFGCLVYIWYLISIDYLIWFFQWNGKNNLLWNTTIPNWFNTNRRANIDFYIRSKWEVKSSKRERERPSGLSIVKAVGSLSQLAASNSL